MGVLLGKEISKGVKLPESLGSGRPVRGSTVVTVATESTACLSASGCD